MGKILAQFNVDFTQNRVVFTQINAKIIRIGAETLDFGFEMDCRASKFAQIDSIFIFLSLIWFFLQSISPIVGLQSLASS